MAHLTTSGEVMDVLGGNSSVARLTASSQNRVSNWRVKGRFPANTYLALQSALTAVGHTAPAELWGMRALSSDAASSLVPRPKSITNMRRVVHE